MTNERRRNGRAALLRRRDRNKWATQRHSPTVITKDRLFRERRSWNMSRIRGKDTTPEKTVRSLLHRLGYCFRLHRRIPVETRNSERGARNAVPPLLLERGEGRGEESQTLNPQLPTKNLVLVKQRVAIFVHGCFWHRHKGCKNCTTPTNRREWWLAKLNGNAARDKLHQAALRKRGWRVIVLWECETERDECLRILRRQLSRRGSTKV